MKQIKTNAMRLLEEKKIDYVAYEYESKGFLSGTEVAHKLGFDTKKVFKTLVTQGEKVFYVFIIPSDEELALKKCAKLTGEKNVHMIHQADIQKVTGYIKGGCCPIGMKKQYKTFLDESAKNHSTIVLSAGRLGCQIELNPFDLSDCFGIEFQDLTQG